MLSLPLSHLQLSPWPVLSLPLPSSVYVWDNNFSLLRAMFCPHVALASNLLIHKPLFFQLAVFKYFSYSLETLVAIETPDDYRDSDYLC